MVNRRNGQLMEERLRNYRRRIIELEGKNRILMEKFQRQPKLEISFLGLFDETIAIDYYEMNPASIEMRYMPLSSEDIPPVLQNMVSSKELMEYNCLLPEPEVIKEYMEHYYYYKRITEGMTELLIKIVNTGKQKAHNIHFSMEFPPELCLYTKEEIEELLEPEPPVRPENPIERAYKQKLNDSPLAVFEKASIHTLKLSYKSRFLPRTKKENEEIKASGFESIIERNKVSFWKESMFQGEHNLIEDLCIVPVQKGSFPVSYSIFCEEYAAKDKNYFTIVVE